MTIRRDFVASARQVAVGGGDMLAKPRHPWVLSAPSLQTQAEPPDATSSCLEIDRHAQQTASHLPSLWQCASSLSHGISKVFAIHLRLYKVHESVQSTLSPRFLRVNNPPNKHTDISTRRIRDRHHSHQPSRTTTPISQRQHTLRYVFMDYGPAHHECDRRSSAWYVAMIYAPTATY